MRKELPFVRYSLKGLIYIQISKIKFCSLTKPLFSGLEKLIFKMFGIGARIKVNVWAGLISNNIIGPFFIDGNLHGEKYLELLQS